MKAAAVLAMDSGQSGLRARFAGRECQQIRVDGLAPRELLDAAAKLIVTCGAQAAEVVCLGYTGDYLLPERRSLAAGLRKMTGARRVLLAHDSITGHLGALDRGAGVVTTSGTGSVTLAWDGRDVAHRFDGLGSTLGDRGGGFALAREGLRLAARTEVGGGPTLLVDTVVHDWGSVRSLAGALQRNEADAWRYVARFTVAMAEAARRGDELALSLWRESAEAAAQTTAAGVRALGRDSVTVAGTGALLAVDIYLEAWTDWLVIHVPEARVVPALGSPLSGASQLRDLDPVQCAALDVYILEGQTS